jgi:hypothetical protein
MWISVSYIDLIETRFSAVRGYLKPFMPKREVLMLFQRKKVWSIAKIVEILLDSGIPRVSRR